MNTVKLDEFHRKIIDALQAKGRLSSIDAVKMEIENAKPRWTWPK